MLHARPWRSYLVEKRPAGTGDSPWQFYQRVPMTDWFQVVGVMPAGGLEFRAQEFIADPPILDMVALTNRTVQLVLFGAPTKNYRVQTAPSITGPLNWQPGPAVAMTNSFRLLPWPTTSQSILFFRVQQE